MKYEDIAGKPVGEVLGMKVRVRYEEVGRIAYIGYIGVKIVLDNGIFCTAHFEDVEVIE